ncbi:MAG: hypothetical protein M3198_13475 [Actinomycetota bacterium]|nr:hypothetical protein [Actinomycetota bacterium]
MTEQMSPGYDDLPENVVPLGQAPDPVEPEPSRHQGRLHRMAIAGMAISALLGIFSMLAFVTVTWPGESGRYVMAVVIGSAVGFMTCASLAVFAAARETYVVRDPSDN